MDFKKLVVGNWKMNLCGSDVRNLCGSLAEQANGLSNAAVWVASPSIHLSVVSETLEGSRVRWGAQNAHWEGSGAFTGEISVPMLEEYGATFTLTGHSERRHVFGENDELVAWRTLGVLARSFSVILCVGETLQQRESGQTNAVLERQLTPVLSDLTEANQKDLLLAYEPVWAIGTGKVASTAEIKETHHFIREFCQATSGGWTPKILYGGSVTPDNFTEIGGLALVDGALVGGASLSFEKFGALVDIAEKLG